MRLLRTVLRDTDHGNHMLYLQSPAAGPGKYIPSIEYSGVTELLLPKILEKLWTTQKLTNTQTKF